MLEMNARHLESELLNLASKNEYYLKQAEDLDNYVKEVEIKISEKKDFFLNNDQAKNLLNESDDQNDFGNEEQTTDGIVNKVAGKKYDNDVSLLNIMKQKLVSLGAELKARKLKMEEFYSSIEYTSLFELQQELKEKENELKRLNELVIMLDNDPAQDQSDMFSKNEKSTIKGKGNRGRSKSSSKQTSKENKNTSVSIYLKDKYNQFVSNSFAQKTKQSIAENQSVSGTAYQKSLIKDAEHTPLLNHEQEEFLYNHILIENYRMQNNLLSKEVNILTEENFQVSEIVSQMKNEANIREEVLQSIEADHESKNKIKLFFQKSFQSEGTEDQKIEKTGRPDSRAASKTVKSVTMINPDEFEKKIKYNN